MKTYAAQACLAPVLLLAATAAGAQTFTAFSFTGTVQSISVPERAPFAVGTQVHGWFQPAADNLGPATGFIRVGDAIEVSTDSEKMIVRELTIGKVTTIERPLGVGAGAYADYWSERSPQTGQRTYLGDYRWQFLNDPTVQWGQFTQPFSYLILSYCLTEPWPYYETMVHLDSIGVVPEPSTWMLTGIGMGLGIGACRLTRGGAASGRRRRPGHPGSPAT